MSPSERESSVARAGALIPRRTLKNRVPAISTSARAQCYQPLKWHFQRGQFNYERLVREKDVAIYLQTWRDDPRASTAFEVIRVRRHNGKRIKGQWVTPSEFYPSSTDWGKYGFTFTDKHAAFAKMHEIACALRVGPAEFECRAAAGECSSQHRTAAPRTPSRRIIADHDDENESRS
jgi:hypothetical protein